MPKYEDYKDLLRNMNEETESVPRVDYAGNIVIRRLIDGQVVNIDEEKEEEFLRILEEEE